MRITKSVLSQIIKDLLLEDDTKSSSIMTGDGATRAKQVLTPERSLYKKLTINGSFVKSENCIIVDALQQKYFVFNNNKIIKSGNISTGRKGMGNVHGSGKTATGLMEISSIAGKGSESGTILVGRKPTNIVLDENESSPRPGHSAEVCSRALTLNGLEEKNKNVTSRSIYLHGTNKAKDIGRPASGGCVRFLNADIIELADNIMKVGDRVYISEDANMLTTITPIDDSTLLDKASEIMGLDEATIDGQEASDEEVAKILARYPEEPTA